MAEYRFDELFDFFLEEFGEPYAVQKADERVMKVYKEKLPEQLFTYWRGVGWCGFGEGRMWMVNPSWYEEILSQRLKGTQLENRKDLSVIARDAFGKLYIWAKGKGHLLDIDPNLNTIAFYSDIDKRNLTKEEENRKMHIFWTVQSPEDIELYDEQRKPMFEKVFAKLGKLQADEMYGWKHHIAIGGERSVENMDKQNIFVFHDIANQLEKPDTSMGIEGLM